MTGAAGDGPDRRARVFGIGLNKTGTFSLNEALKTLGYRGLHGGDLQTQNQVQRAIDEQKPMLSYLDPDYDAFTDVFGVVYCFFLADVQYPGSKFILTVRGLEDWLDSRRRHVEKNRQRAARGEYKSGFLDVDTYAWRAEYVRHEAVVRAYFADRPDDLLIYNLTAGEGWEPLCAFLDQPVPDTPFPWVNRFRPISPPTQSR